VSGWPRQENVNLFIHGQSSAQLVETNNYQIEQTSNTSIVWCSAPYYI